VNEVEARVVRDAFAPFLQHRQMTIVARMLTERGLPCGSRRPSRFGLRWTKDPIARVLRSPLYADFMMHADALHPDESLTPQDRHLLTGTLFRRRGSPVLLTEQPPPPEPKPVRRPATVARRLALAHHLQGAIDWGLVADRAAVALKLGLTRTRVTQLLDLQLLAPDLRARVLELETVDGVEPLAERTLRAVTNAGTRAEQRAAWLGIAPGLG
jgi:hypothetical protein